LKTWRADVIGRYAHPGRGFTQGLIVSDGTIWESIGRYGASALYRYPLGAARLGEHAVLPEELFAEGICRAGNAIWQLTYRERIALRWDAHSLELVKQVPYDRDGWGICVTDGHIVTSDGSGELVRRDPQTLDPRAVVHVRCAGRRVRGLNDLAWSAGVIWANVVGTHYLAGIDPESGEVTDVVNASPAGELYPGYPHAVMNGIASMPSEGNFLLTGKGWRWIRHVRLRPDRDRAAYEQLFTGWLR
jgi:glutaminyl-peptide cyclotransferase